LFFAEEVPVRRDMLVRRESMKVYGFLDYLASLGIKRYGRVSKPSY